MFLLTENADNATITALVCTRQLEVLSVSSSGQLKIWDLRRPENKAARVLLMCVCVCQTVIHMHTHTHTHSLLLSTYLSLSSLFLLSPISFPPYSLLPPLPCPLLSLLASLSPSLSFPLLPLPLVQFWRTRGATLPRPPSSPTTSGGTWSQRWICGVLGPATGGTSPADHRSTQ